jgi:hypothetical protein
MDNVRFDPKTGKLNGLSNSTLEETLQWVRDNIDGLKQGQFSITTETKNFTTIDNFNIIIDIDNGRLSYSFGDGNSFEKVFDIGNTSGSKKSKKKRISNSNVIININGSGIIF